MPPRLRFERFYSPTPSPPVVLARSADFHHIYSRAASDDSFVCWMRRAESIARWRDVRCSMIVGDRSSWHVWLSMCEATDLELNSTLAKVARQFGVSVVVSVPAGMAVAATVAVKPVIDGLLASFQRFSSGDQGGSRRVVTQLAAVLPDRTTGTLANHLTRPEGRLFAQPPFNARGRPALNPCDDRCVAGEIFIVPDAACTAPFISGSVYPVVAR